MDYNSLVADKTTSGSIRGWVNHAELDAAFVLELAQGLIYQTLRVREMRAVFADLSPGAGDGAIALPSGFLDPIALTDKTNDLRLRLRTPEWMEAQRQYDAATLLTGTPRNYAIFGEALQFEVAYASAATLRLVGYRKPDPLSGASPTNFLTGRFPQLLHSACLVYAFKYRNNDERMQAELATLTALIGRTNAESDLSYRGLETDNTSD